MLDRLACFIVGEYVRHLCFGPSKCTVHVSRLCAPHLARLNTCGTKLPGFMNRSTHHTTAALLSLRSRLLCASEYALCIFASTMCILCVVYSVYRTVSLTLHVFKRLYILENENPFLDSKGPPPPIPSEAGRGTLEVADGANATGSLENRSAHYFMPA